MQGTRIPASKSSSFESWDMPEVKDGQIVHVEKLRHRGPRGELINVNKDDVVYGSLTAGQLEEITLQAYADVREQAHKEGFQQGHSEGYQAGLQEGSVAVKEQAESLHQATESMMEHLEGQEDEVEQSLVNLTTLIASAVVRRELIIDSSQIKLVIRDAIAALPLNASNITVFLSEQDFDNLTVNTEVPPSWQLQIAKDILPGGCRVETLQTVVDFTLEEQFQQLVNSLVEQRYADLVAQARARVPGDDTSDSSD